MGEEEKEEEVEEEEEKEERKGSKIHMENAVCFGSMEKYKRK